MQGSQNNINQTYLSFDEQQQLVSALNQLSQLLGNNQQPFQTNHLPQLSQLAQQIQTAPLNSLQSEDKEVKQVVFSRINVQGVNIVNDLQSKKLSWQDLDVPQWLITKLINSPVMYKKPSIIQTKTIQAIMEKGEIRHNFIFQSSNGSGKTGAFVIPAIMSIDPNINAYQILIVSHARELNRQTHKFLEVLLKDTPIKVQLATDQNVKFEVAHIFVGSTGSLLNKIKMQQIDLAQLKMFIIDECDEILKNNQSDLNLIINSYLKDLGINPMYALFSATINEEIQKQAESFVNQPTPRIYLAAKQALKLENVKQLKIKMPNDKAKRKFLEEFYIKNSGQAMIFVNSKETAKFLQSLLINIGLQRGIYLKADILTGDIADNERDMIIDNFRLGYSQALISTNVLARGIDVPEVDIVINYDLPTRSDDGGYFEPDYANYLHRVGRTGRFQTDGIAVTFYLQDREGVQEYFMKRISEHWEKDIQEISNFDQFMELFYEMRPNLRPGEEENFK